MPRPSIPPDEAGTNAPDAAAAQGAGGRLLAHVAGWVSAPPCVRWTMAAVLAMGIPYAAALLVMPRILVVHPLHDIFVPLDAGWRLLNGQIPHLDFNSPLGIAYFALHAAPMLVFGPDARAIHGAEALGLLITAGFALLFIPRRLGALWAGLFCVTTVLAAASPRALSGYAWDIAHLADYNRLCWALLAVVAATVLFEPVQKRTRRVEWAEAIGVAFLLLLLAFTKLSFAAAAAPAFAAALIAAPANRRIALFGGAGAALIFAGACLTPFGAAYIHDILVIARADASRSLLMRLPGEIVGNLGPAAALGLGWAALRRAAQDKGRGRILMTGLLATMALGQFQNGQDEMPMLLAAIFCVAELLRRAGGFDKSHGVLAAVFGAAAFLLAAYGAAQDMAALDAEAHLAAGPAPTDWGADLGGPRGIRVPRGIVNHPDFVLEMENGVGADAIVGALPETAKEDERREPHWRDIGVPLDDFEWKETVQRGAALLRREAKPGDRVLTFAMSNPFPFLLRLPSPTGGLLWWDYERSFSDAAHPAPGKVLGGADIVMVPKADYRRQDTAAMLRIYGSALHARFRLAADTPLWELWRRR